MQYARGRAHLNPAVKFTGLPGHRAACPFDCTGNWLPIETPSGIPLYVLCIRESLRDGLLDSPHPWD